MYIKAVIYDMDGVLIDSEPLWRLAEIETFAEVGLKFNDEMCKQTMGMRTKEVIDYWYEKTPWEGLNREEMTKRLVFKVKKLILEQGEALEGVHESLAYFKSKNIPLALASSSSMHLIEAVVDKLGVRDYFSVINSAQDLEYGKPHPEIFLMTAKDLGVLPQDCLVIEDSFFGVLAAKAAMMQVIAIPDAEGREDPRFIIADKRLNSLTEIKDLNIV